MTHQTHHLKPASFRRALLSWYRTNDRTLPWRVRWQDTGDPYCVWVSEIMLQQTLIKVVIPAYERFMARFPTVDALANADEEDVRLAARGLGYYRRFGMLHRGAREIVAARKERGRSWWPASSQEWLEISGIGPYTASAIASITLNEPVHVLDGNVERVLCRVLALREPIGTPSLKRRLNPIAADLLDATHPGDFNQAMMELGQLVCTKANPACDRCPVAKGCLAKAQGCQGQAPQPKQRPEPIEVALTAKIALRKSSVGVKTGHEVGLVWRDNRNRFLKESWGFEFSDFCAGRREGKGIAPVFSHSITNHRITVAVEVVMNQTTPAPSGDSQPKSRWLKPDEVEKNLLANLDRKAWRLAQKVIPAL